MMRSRKKNIIINTQRFMNSLYYVVLHLEYDCVYPKYTGYFQLLVEVLHRKIFPDLEELATNISEEIRSVQPCECETKSLHDQSVMTPLLIAPTQEDKKFTAW